MRIMRAGMILFFLFVFSLVSCSPYTIPAQSSIAEANAVLRTGGTLGQTFVARENGLQGVEIFLRSEHDSFANVYLHLRASPSSADDLAVSSLSLRQVTAPGFYRFSFSPQNNSFGRAYYLLLDFQEDGEAIVGTGSGDSYLDGALYQDGKPLDSQMSFRLLYNPADMFLGWASQVAKWLGVLSVSIFLFILPGLGLLTIWNGSSYLSWVERIGFSAGLSLALYPLLILWTNLAQLHLGVLYAFLPGSIALIVIIWHNRNWRPGDLSAYFGQWRRSSHLLPDLALLVLIALTFAVRFWVIRSLDLPLWGDSYQHTLIAQLVVDNGGLFDSWKPYADLQSFTYHFGFHSAAAVFLWATGVDASQAVLWVGQVLNGLAVLSLVPLTMRLTDNRWAAVGAILLAGLLSPMPMYYVNWGRYTQLAGQVILPSAIGLTWLALDGQSRDWRLLLLTWVGLGGLALTHYRILIFAGLFPLAYFLLKVNRQLTKRLLATMFWILLGSGVLFLPWFVHTFVGKFASLFAQQMTTPVEATANWMEQYNSFGDLSAYLPVAIWILWLASVIWSIWKRERNALLLNLWWIFILLAANPQWFRMPGEGVLSNFAVFIAAYIPVSVLLGAALGSWTTGRRFSGGKWQLALSFAVIIIGLIGARQRLGDIRIAESALATRPDIYAASWIQQNTEPNAQFLVNSFFAYADIDMVGSDGGWWLPFIAHRSTSVPPLNYESEQGPRPDYQEWITQPTHEIHMKGLDDPEVLTLLSQRDINYVYVGQRQGRVNYNGTPLLQIERILKSPNFYLIYHQDRVWIFKVVK